MGKKKRKQKANQVGNTQTMVINKKPAPMDPALIKSFASGRKSGYQEGLAKGFLLQNDWIQEIDKHVKGIGPKKKLEIEKYFADRLKAAIQDKQIEDVEIL